MAVTEAAGPNITIDGVTYKLLGLDENGSKVYQDVEVLREQSEQNEPTNGEMEKDSADKNPEKPLEKQKKVVQ